MPCLTQWKPFPSHVFYQKQKSSVPVLTLHSREKTDAASQPSAGFTSEAFAASPVPVSPLRVTDKNPALFYLPSIIYYYPGARKHALGLNVLTKIPKCAGRIGSLQWWWGEKPVKRGLMRERRGKWDLSGQRWWDRPAAVEEGKSVLTSGELS